MLILLINIDVNTRHYVYCFSLCYLKQALISKSLSKSKIYLIVKMDRENHFTPKSKILQLINQISTERLEKEVTKNIQNYAEKFVGDVVNRSSMIAKHKQSDIVTSDDILFTVEKEFDFSFGSRVIKSANNAPLEEHKEKLAEISKQK